MIKRLVTAALVAAAVALVVQSAPDIKRYIQIRQM